MWEYIVGVYVCVATVKMSVHSFKTLKNSTVGGDILGNCFLFVENLTFSKTFDALTSGKNTTTFDELKWNLPPHSAHASLFVRITSFATMKSNILR